MRGMGQDLMKGLQLGLEDQSVKVNAAVGGIAGGIAGDGAGPASAGTTGAGAARSLVVNVNIHGNIFGILDLDHHITEVVRDAVQGGAFRGVITTPGE